MCRTMRARSLRAGSAALVDETVMCRRYHANPVKVRWLCSPQGRSVVSCSHCESSKSGAAHAGSSPGWNCHRPSRGTAPSERLRRMSSGVRCEAEVFAGASEGVSAWNCRAERQTAIPSNRSNADEPRRRQICSRMTEEYREVPDLKQLGAGKGSE